MVSVTHPIDEHAEAKEMELSEINLQKLRKRLGKTFSTQKYEMTGNSLKAKEFFRDFYNIA